MKTAMQEWFDELKANYPYMASEIYQKGFAKYLEKEKEQIENAFDNGKWDSMAFKGTPKEQYYNQTYK